MFSTLARSLFLSHSALLAKNLLFTSILSKLFSIPLDIFYIYIYIYIYINSINISYRLCKHIVIHLWCDNMLLNNYKKYNNHNSGSWVFSDIVCLISTEERNTQCRTICCDPNKHLIPTLTKQIHFLSSSKCHFRNKTLPLWHIQSCVSTNSGSILLNCHAHHK